MAQQHYTLKNRENKELITPTLCPVPWLTQYYESDGKKTMCCKATSFVTSDVDWNGELIKQVRKQMLEGKKPNVCTLCYDEEDIDKGLSFRQEWINMLDQRDPELGTQILNNTNSDGMYNGLPEVQQITLGNTCTNQCNMCSPWNSSALNNVFKQIHKGLNIPYDEKMFNPRKYKWVTDDDYWNKQIYPRFHYAKALILSGGEPLIVKRFEQILEYCVDKHIADGIEIYFHTNTAQLPSEHIQALFKEFKHVLITASIDDINERNEYIRYPTTWTQTQKFIEWGEGTGDNITLDVYVTVQNMNIYHLPDILDYWLNQNLTKFNKNFGGFVHTYPCHMPEKFNSRILPRRAKEKVREKFDRWVNNLDYVCPSNDPVIIENSKWALQRLNFLINNMEDENVLSPHLNKTNEEHFDDFIQWTLMQDKLRGTDYTEVFPWLTM